MKLSTYFRSSAAYRVRIAFNLKGIDYEPELIHLLRNGGEQHGEAYCAKNPSELVPTLEADDGRLLGQSLAIIEYLDETHPEPPLLPRDPWARAQVRAFALAIACDIHPVNNLRVLQYLKLYAWAGPAYHRHLVPPLDRRRAACAGSYDPARRCCRALLFR